MKLVAIGLRLFAAKKRSSKQQLHLTSANDVDNSTNSERPIQKKPVSADTDNQPILPILSADISAEIEAKIWCLLPRKLYF